MQTVLWIGLYQSLVLIPVLGLRREGRAWVNRMMAAMMVFMADRLTASLIRFSAHPDQFSVFLEFSAALNLLYGPLLYFFIRAFLERSFRLRGVYLLHLIPAMLMLAVRLIWYLADRTHFPGIAELVRGPSPPAWPVRLAALLVAIHFLCYTALGVRLILRFNRHVKMAASFTDRLHLRWLVFLTAVLLLPVASGILTLMVIGPPRLAPYPSLGISLMVSIIGIAAWVRPEILNGLPPALMVEADADLEPKRYESSPLTPEQKARYLAQLQTYMDSRRPWLNQELTLGELAEQTGINTRYLSQVINELLGRNFLEFVNSYRIRRAQELLLHPAYQHYTVLAIAQEVGFRSRSAFYDAFRQQTGLTPSAFRSRAADTPVQPG